MIVYPASQQKNKTEDNIVKKRSIISVILGGALALSSSFAYAADNQDFTSIQKKAIENIIHEYLVSNPQVLVEASQKLQQQEQSAMMQKAEKAISANGSALFDQKDPIAGNPKGTVNVVEFFDYQCIHCKSMNVAIDNLIKQNKDLRVVFKEFPIFGANSQYAATAALASEKQGKYFEFHTALMKAQGQLSKDEVLKIAKTVGLNVEQLEKDMKDPQYEQQIKANYKLAQTLGLMGTPAFIITQNPYPADGKSVFIPGETSQESIQKAIEQFAKA